MDKLELRFPPLSKYIMVAAHMAASVGRIVCRDVEESEKVPNFVATLELVVSEVCTNAVKHGAGYRENAEIIMLILVDEERLTIKVKDFNTPFDFEAIREPDLKSHPENGYGIFLMRQFMDEVKYSHEEGWNCITLVKHKPCHKDG